MATDVKQQGLIKKTVTENKVQNTKPQLKDLVQQMLPQIAKALPKVITPERFTRIALTALSSNPKLASCSRDSFLGGLMQAAQLGLEPNTPLGQAYLIPYGNSCQFQIGYKGLIDLAYRSGDVQSIYAHCVRENDEFDYQLGLEPVLKHIPAKENRGDLIYVYAVFRLKNGGYGFEVMSVADITAHAKKYSKAYSSGPWKTNFDEMAKKTVLIRALKYAPIKTEFVQAVVADENIVTMSENDPENLTVVYAEEATINAETGEVTPVEELILTDEK